MEEVICKRGRLGDNVATSSVSILFLTTCIIVDLPSPFFNLTFTVTNIRAYLNVIHPNKNHSKTNKNQVFLYSNHSHISSRLYDFKEVTEFPTVNFLIYKMRDFLSTQLNNNYRHTFSGIVSAYTSFRGKILIEITSVL